MSSDRLKGIEVSARFGLGAKRGESRVAAADPRGWLLEQVRDPGPVWRPRATAAAQWSRLMAGGSMATDMPKTERKAMRKVARREMRTFFKETMAPELRADVVQRFAHGVSTGRPFAERMALFWSNHFSVSAQKGRLVAAGVLGYEAEAIRAHMDGDFAQMLIGVAQHPVMLFYLDNHASTGPNSKVGRRRKRGLNENFAREILELHTLGVDGGYQQEDVGQLARAMTGWGFGRANRGGANQVGRFEFNLAMHEPGSRRLLGRKYPEAGAEQGTGMLRALAVHPSTARHLATKLARHFVADQPPAWAIDELERTYLASDGNLPALHRAVANLAGMSLGPKLKTPYEYLLSVFRGLDLDALPERYVHSALSALGQKPFAAPSPAGWPDSAAHWGAPSALLSRVEWALRTGQRFAAGIEPRALAGDILAEPSDSPTILALSRAASAQQGLGLLLAAPSFQWR